MSTYVWNWQVLWKQLIRQERNFLLDDLWRLVAQFAVSKMVYFNGYNKTSTYFDHKLTCWDESEHSILFEINMTIQDYNILGPWRPFWHLCPLDDSLIYLFDNGRLGFINLATLELPKIIELSEQCSQPHNLGTVVILKHPVPTLFAVGGTNGKGQGGLCDEKSLTTSMDQYDIVSKKWTTLLVPTPFIGRCDLAIATSSHQFIAVGHFKPPNTGLEYKLVCFAFDSVTKSWTFICTIPESNHGSISSGIVVGTKLLIGTILYNLGQIKSPMYSIDLQTMKLEKLSIDSDPSTSLPIDEDIYRLGKHNSFTMFQYNGTIRLIKIQDTNYQDQKQFIYTLDSNNRWQLDRLIPTPSLHWLCSNVSTTFVL